MHEAALMKDLMHKILQTAREQGAKRVVGIRVKLGALSHMTPEHFREHFAEVSPGTLAAGAQVEASQMSDIHDPKAQEIELTSIEVED
jgi:hydrogenase nickel incorporation protein HypA/HybF